MSRHFIHSHGDTLWVTFEGNYTANDVQKFLVDLRHATSKWATYKFFVCDVSGVPRTSSDIHRPSQEVLSYLRDLGVEWMVVIAPAAILSMIIRTTAFVARLQVRVVADIPAAKREVDHLRPLVLPPQSEVRPMRSTAPASLHSTAPASLHSTAPASLHSTAPASLRSTGPASLASTRPISQRPTGTN